ncbi:hypothetical protein [Natrarchaeobaculum aegyptiacum]|uniref:DUF3368 domain-containing protein n=1 Tax=Natrarchaeobaculum aegyptiacum TaxID=745377 RepID=A0A2Z2HSG2_9EURY|nr:hypothetical protein [Natrarchaeobaculum aegyptiacum]ARS90079.1 hypothetical protein B1756_10295 [Natrarchaeobaculum aegyptiacum]
MSDDRTDRRTLLVDASVFITLADIGSLELLQETGGDVSMPHAVVEEVSSEPATSDLERARGDWLSTVDGHDSSTSDEWADRLETAATQLGRSTNPDDRAGDVPLLAAALAHENPVVVTDDKPLRKTCKTLSIPVSSSIGVLIRAVERGDLEPGTATDRLEAMDEVGARLSVGLFRRAERLIEEATKK